MNVKRISISNTIREKSELVDKGDHFPSEHVDLPNIDRNL